MVAKAKLCLSVQRLSVHDLDRQKELIQLHFDTQIVLCMIVVFIFLDFIS
jgi:hypothetical protein